MVDYTWVANLLREIETFATSGQVVGLSNKLSMACAALLIDTEGNAEISCDARLWLERVATRQIETIPTSHKGTCSVPICIHQDGVDAAGVAK
jgi:hypothetical protein